MMQRHDRLDSFAVGLMIFLCAIWGLNQIAAKVADASFSPLLQGGLRSAISAVLLWGWSRARRQPMFRRDGSLWPGLLAGLLFAAEFACIFAGLNFTTASRGVVFVYTSPIVVAIGLHWLVPAERLGRWQAVGLVCSFAGVVVAFQETLALPVGRQWLGDCLLLAGGALWGATTVVMRASRLSTIPAAKTLFYQLGVSAVALLLASFAVGEPGLLHPTPLGWALLAWQGVAISFASYLAWFWLVLHYPATRLSSFTFLAPVFGTAAGVVLLGEPLSPQLVAAAALVALGVWMVNRRGPAKPARR